MSCYACMTCSEVLWRPCYGCITILSQLPHSFLARNPLILPHFSSIFPHFFPTFSPLFPHFFPTFPQLPPTFPHYCPNRFPHFPGREIPTSKLGKWGIPNFSPLFPHFLVGKKWGKVGKLGFSVVLMKWGIKWGIPHFFPTFSPLQDPGNSRHRRDFQWRRWGGCGRFLTRRVKPPGLTGATGYHRSQRVPGPAGCAALPRRHRPG